MQDFAVSTNGDTADRAEVDSDLKGSWQDPTRAELYSHAEPFRLESITNNLVASTLRAGFKTFIPLAYFASRFADSTLRPVESADASAIILDGSGGIKVKAKSFTDVPLSQIDLNDFNSIARGMPRAFRQHFIPKGTDAPGHRLALLIADMFDGMFNMVKDRSDFELGFDIYKVYVDRAYRQWFTFPNANIRIDVFHSGLYQESLLSWQTLRVKEEDARRKAPKVSISSYSKGQGQGQRRSFRDGDTSTKENTRPCSGGKCRCYLCGSTEHNWNQHKPRSSDFLHKSGRQFVDSEGHAYCHSFNGPFGCSKSPCTFAHKCGLCGSSEHGSQDHPR